ncbi:MAG: efflux RND transporter periplasmic adaptor subunit [Treponema sp.]|nr:efflux RND transporter periplasmic adaptor subunit [Treponema sp.]
MEEKNRTGIIILAALAVTALAIVGIQLTNKKDSKGMMGRGRGPAGTTVVTVRSQEAAVQTLKDYVLTNGEGESPCAVEVDPSVRGKVSSVNVMLGSHVNKGDIIAYVDPSEPGSNYAKSPVIAPISGSIVSTPSKVGAKVSTTTALTMIGDIENLQISASVPERYVAELKPGLKAQIGLEAYPGVIFNASVSRVSPVVDKTSRTKQVVLNFDKKDSRVNAGMFAKVKLFTSEYKGQLVVPKDSLVQDDDNSYLFVVNDNSTVTKRTVKLGKSVDTLIQVTDNLMAGERVVTEGMLSLSDGASVNDISNPKPVEEKANEPL